MALLEKGVWCGRATSCCVKEGRAQGAMGFVEMAQDGSTNPWALRHLRHWGFGWYDDGILPNLFPLFTASLCDLPESSLGLRGLVLSPCSTLFFFWNGGYKWRLV